jgi:hypothetical protein
VRTNFSDWVINKAANWLTLLVTNKENAILLFSSYLEFKENKRSFLFKLNEDQLKYIPLDFSAHIDDLLPVEENKDRYRLMLNMSSKMVGETRKEKNKRQESGQVAEKNKKGGNYNEDKEEGNYKEDIEEEEVNINKPKIFKINQNILFEEEKKHEKENQVEDELAKALLAYFAAEIKKQEKRNLLV